MCAISADKTSLFFCDFSHFYNLKILKLERFISPIFFGIAMILILEPRFYPFALLSYLEYHSEHKSTLKIIFLKVLNIAKQKQKKSSEFSTSALSQEGFAFV